MGRLKRTARLCLLLWVSSAGPAAAGGPQQSEWTIVTSTIVISAAPAASGLGAGLTSVATTIAEQLSPNASAPSPQHDPLPNEGAEECPSEGSTAALEPESAHGVSPTEAALFDLVNGDRALYGVGVVAFDAELLEVARTRAASQLAASTLSHTDSSGDIALTSLLAESEVCYRLAAENLARAPIPDEEIAGPVHEALMAVPSERASILEPAFERLAVGAATDDSGVTVFALIFRAL